MAKPSEAQAISELALRSKAHWNYSKDQLAVFRKELTISPDEVGPRRTHVLEDSDRILGFYTLAPLESGEVELEHIFIEPASGSHLVPGIFLHGAGFKIFDGIRQHQHCGGGWEPKRLGQDRT